MFALFHLKYLTPLAYYFRDSKTFALFNLESLNLLYYFLSVSMSFALLI